MLRIMLEDAFTDEITSNPNWQKLNRLCNKYGYKVSPYARVEVSNSGKETLEDIEFWTEDDELPGIDTTIRNNKVQFELYFKYRIDNKTPEEFEDYVEKLKGVTELLSILKSFDYMDLYRYVQE